MSLKIDMPDQSARIGLLRAALVQLRAEVNLRRKEGHLVLDGRAALAIIGLSVRMLNWINTRNGYGCGSAVINPAELVGVQVQGAVECAGDRGLSFTSSQATGNEPWLR